MPAPLTTIGEIGISTAERDVILRPSLAAMASLGSPKEIVQLFGLLHSAPPVNPYFPVESIKRYRQAVFWAAYDVISACASEDISDVIGTTGERLNSYRPGAMPMDDFLPIARSLLKHGIVGAVKIESSGKGDYSDEFNARDHVATAVAHLGVSEAEAWNMTMTSFVGAMRAKYPPTKSGPPTEAEYDKTMSWFAEVQARREALKRGN